MTPFLSRVLRPTSLFLIAPALISAGTPPKAAPPKPMAAKAKPAPAKPAYTGPWLYENSDIPVDPAWTFGVLPNKVRYAVRKGSVPPRQVSIRVAMDAGSLMEREDERGFAHFIEHLSFRGSRHVPDGEAKRVWQRFGASFGSDTNALTSPTQTIFKLDLPNADPATMDESLKILAGMMAAPSITDQAVDAERRTVLAEAREQTGPQSRIGDATRALFFAGQLLATRTPIGTVQALNGATAAKVKAFHTRWYRPDRLIVSISGDGDPAQFEALIKKHFSDWLEPGMPTPDPDFGRPSPDAPNAVVLVEPGLPTLITLSTLRPWERKDDTIAYNQGKLVDLVATRLINRRLETRARAGGSFLQAEVNRDDVSRSVDATFVSIVPVGEDWKAALADVRAVIADAIANPASQEDIDREISEFTAALDVAVESERAEASSKQADDIIEAVNIRETVATAGVARAVFGAMRNQLGPAEILASTRKQFEGVGPRVLLSVPREDLATQADLAAALAAPVSKPASTNGQTAIGFDRLPKLPPAGKVKSSKPLRQTPTQMVTLSNGVRVLLYPNAAEAGRIYISARFGKGMQALRRDRVSSAWAAGSAIVASGLGDLDQEALDRMTSGRRIGMSFEVGDDAFYMRAVTRPADLKDQLALLAAKLYQPRWDSAPIARARAGALLGLSTADSSPQSVLSRELNLLLHGGDKRWAMPSRADVDAVTLDSFRAEWEPLLAAGEIELSVFGDFETEAGLSAILPSFGALPKRPAARALAGGDTSPGPKPTPEPLSYTHSGAADQAMAVLAWEIGGGLKQTYESRVLDVVAAIFGDRLFERFREGEGGSYSPSVSSNWPTGMKGGGNFLVAAQLKPEMINRFFAMSREIAADLAKNPVTDDELQRAIGPMRQVVARSATGNGFWLSQLSGASKDKQKIAAINTLSRDLARMSPADLQKVSARYLLPDKIFSMIVVPGTSKAQ